MYYSALKELKYEQRKQWKGKGFYKSCLKTVLEKFNIEPTSKNLFYMAALIYKADSIQDLQNLKARCRFSEAEAVSIIEKTDCLKKRLNSKLVNWFFTSKSYRTIFKTWIDNLDQSTLTG